MPPALPNVEHYSLDTCTSASLLARLGSHDPDAWQRLVRLYGPLVYYWCRHAHLQSADMVDVFQEVFRSVSQNVGKFRRDQPGQTFRGWLRTITRNKLIDHFRRLRQQPAAQGGSTANAQLHELPDFGSHVDVLSDDRTLATAEDAIVFRQALDIVRLEFEDRTWQAFWRTAVEGQSARQAAAEFGMTPEAVRQAKSRVLRRLRDEFGDTLD